jgi:hypothetical protein
MKMTSSPFPSAAGALLLLACNGPTPATEPYSDPPWLVCEPGQVEADLEVMLPNRVTTRDDGSLCIERTTIYGECTLWADRFAETDPAWGSPCEGQNWRFTDRATGDCIQTDFHCWPDPIPDPRFGPCTESTYESCCTRWIFDRCNTVPGPG